MRVTRVEFAGFRRLADAQTNIDGPLTAFVGFNEAGKTTLLEALAWFSSGGPISPVDYNRTRPPASDTTIVRVFYGLDDADRAAVAHIPMDDQPRTLILSKNRDGQRFRTIQPKPKRPANAFASAQERLNSARTRLARQLVDSTEQDQEDPTDWVSTVFEWLSKPDMEWPQEATHATTSLADWLGQTPVGHKHARDAKLAGLLEDVLSLLSEDHPSEQAWAVLSKRNPEFVMFREADRALETSYEINPDQRGSVHPAVVRLLALARIDLDDMWSHIQAGDSTKRETLLEHANDRLREIFDQAWNQSKVTVRFNVNGTLLEVLIKELNGGDVTNISERSDGMKTFVALVAFLETGEHTTPPVLLVDEAETHLHYDAQADLVSVLLKSVDTTQVFYTTHSPGCLPGDLGTGVRVVAKEPGHADASIIKNNFWEGEGPGFSPLLFAMGAGAAAFSMCRQAVLAEGAADMVLLPTLIRQATELSDLDYQVAPGLANAHGSGIRVEEVAAKVVYLVDGDSGGREHQSALRRVGVDQSRIFTLPEGFATEDLVHRDDYIETVNNFLDTMGQAKRFALSDAPTGVPISKAFFDWALRNKVQRPSKVEVAYALLRMQDRRLTPTGKRVLARLHQHFTEAFTG